MDEKLFSLHRYFLHANHSRKQFMTAIGTDATDTERDMLLDFWYGCLYVVSRRLKRARTHRRDQRLSPRTHWSSGAAGNQRASLGGRRRAGRSVQDGDRARGAIDAHTIAGSDALGAVDSADDGGKAHLTTHDRGV